MFLKLPIRNFTLLCSLMFLSLPADARFKCWTNSDGVRECGQNVPPEYAQQGHEEINKLGITVDKQAPAKTEEELEAERKLAEQQAEQERLRRIKEREDRILLETFTSVEDINLTRDSKISAMETAIILSNKRIEKLQLELDTLIVRAATQERRGKVPDEQLVQDIASLKRQIEDNQEFIAQKRREQDAMRAEYAQYVERFERLKQ